MIRRPSLEKRRAETSKSLGIDIGYIPQDIEVLALNLDVEGFPGACVDTGATESEIGRLQAEAYSSFTGSECHVQDQDVRRYLTFGRQRVPSIGKIKVRIPINNGESLPVKVDFVDIPISFLLGLSPMDKYGVYANTVRNILVCENEEVV